MSTLYWSGELGRRENRRVRQLVADADRPEQRKVVASVEALQELGPSAGRPLVDSVEGSRHSNMKELRVTQTMRIFFAFDPRRVAILLIGGDKAGKTKRFYKRMISQADRIYDEHLQGTAKEKQAHGK